MDRPVLVRDKNGRPSFRIVAGDRLRSGPARTLCFNCYGSLLLINGYKQEYKAKSIKRLVRDLSRYHIIHDVFSSAYRGCK